MSAQGFLNLQHGYLVSPRLEDVNIRPTKNAIDTVLDDRCIASAKPAIAESIACGVGLAPVFRKDSWTADFDLARCSRGNRLAVLSDKLKLDAGQGRPDCARHALTPPPVRPRPADLCHAVALQECVTADFLPAWERGHR